MALLSNTASETARQVAIVIGGILLLYAGFSEADPLGTAALFFIGVLFIGVGAFWRWG